MNCYRATIQRRGQKPVPYIRWAISDDDVRKDIAKREKNAEIIKIEVDAGVRI